MDVSISHLIGTVAIIGLVLTAGLSYQIVTSSIQDDINKQQLTQISEYVALNIAEMTNLQQFAINSNHYMIRSMNLPTDLAGKTYMIQIINGTSQDSTSYIVRAFLTVTPSVYSEAIIPLNTSSTWITINTQPGDFLFESSQSSYNVHYDAIVYGNGEVLVWGRTLWDDIVITSMEVGVGWKENYNGET